ncbi:unnamed protein product [Auanema sp. JU1783]|nr:unnamed protein product [Auanema sp. JU1783]
MSEEQENKYAYLLKPIKDLEQNFDVDIITVLDGYAQELQALVNQQQFEVENAHRFNFAEAAMLIQGTVSVFGKKVDLVFNEAFNFMESLKSTNKSKKDDEGFENDGDDASDIEESNSFTDPSSLQDFRNLKAANLGTITMKHRPCKIPKISIMPMSLMPLADFEKCNVPIYSHKKSKDIIGKKDDFKINTGYIGPRGALLLDLLNAQILDEFASDQFMQLGMHCSDDEDEDAQKENVEVGDMDSGRGTPDDDVQEEIELPSYDGPEGRPSNFIEQCRRGTGDNLCLARPSTVLREDAMECMDNSGFGDVDHFHEPSLPARKADPWEVVDDVEPDPLQEKYIDPYEEVNWKRHPTKVVNCFTPSQPQIEKKRKLDKKIDSRQRTMQTIQYINEHFYMKSHKERLNLNKGDDWETDALFRYIVQRQKERAIVKREKIAQRRRRVNNKVAAQLEEEEDILGGAYENDDVEDEQNVGTQNLPSQPKAILFQDIDDDELRNAMNIPSLYMGRQPTMANIHERGNDIHVNLGDNRPTSDMTTEEILNFYMNKYWTSAQEATSRLAARVQDWEERMVPLLEEEETRKEFDIHEYGSNALDLYSDTGETKTFSELVVGKKFFEVSRYFLASLMLANTYNLKIEDNQQLGLGMETNTMRATLLKKERHHDVFNQDGAL